MILKCLFPAAGYGTRFLPATKAMPKEMLPVLTKPLMEAGCCNIGIVTGRGKRSIEDHFDINYELEHQISGTDKEELLKSIRQVTQSCTFSYTRQNEMKGLGHAILTGETLIGNEAFGVILADDLCINPNGKSVLSQMVTLYKKYHCSIVAIEEVKANEVDKYGIIQGEAPSNLAIIGRYILTPDIFDILRVTKPGKKGEIQITDALLEQAKQGRVLAYKFQGSRYDCGSVSVINVWS